MNHTLTIPSFNSQGLGSGSMHLSGGHSGGTDASSTGRQPLLVSGLVHQIDPMQIRGSGEEIDPAPAGRAGKTPSKLRLPPLANQAKAQSRSKQPIRPTHPLVPLRSR